MLFRSEYRQYKSRERQTRDGLASDDTESDIKEAAKGGISVNKEKLTDQDMVIDCSSLLDEKYLLVQRGKKNYYLLIVK